MNEVKQLKRTCQLCNTARAKCIVHKKDIKYYCNECYMILKGAGELK